MDLLGSNLNKFCLGLSQFNNSLYKKKKFLEKDILKFIEYAIRKNIHIFDTANNYGNTEVVLGKLSKEEKNKIIVSTKAGYISDGNRNFTNKYLEIQIKNSLKRLKREKIDIFFLNKPSLEEIKKNNLLEFMNKMKKKGLISLGGIIVGNEKLPKYVYKDRSIDCFSFLYNIINIDHEKDIILSKKYNKINFVRSPFNNGLLTNNFKNSISFSKDDYRYEFFSGENFNLKIDKIIYLKKKFMIKDNQLGDFAFNFINYNKHVDFCYFGATKKIQTKHLLNLYDNTRIIDKKKYLNIKNEIRYISKIIKTNDEI